MAVDRPLVTVRAECFGEYRVPSHRIVSMTAVHVVRSVAALCATNARQPAAPFSVQFETAEVEANFHRLHCSTQLSMDVPILLHNEVASLVIKCWTYLVWMYMIENDTAAGEMSGMMRAQILWSMMRPFEHSSCTAQAINAGESRNVQPKIRRGLTLTALLLSHESLLVDLLELSNVSSDALVTLTYEQLNADTLQRLIQQGKHFHGRITKHNRHLMLSPVTTSEDHDRAADAPAALRVTNSPVSTESSVHGLIMLSAPPSSSSSPALLLEPSSSSLNAGSSGSNTSTSRAHDMDSGTAVMDSEDEAANDDMVLDKTERQRDSDNEVEEHEDKDDCAMKVDNLPQVLSRRTRKSKARQREQRIERRATSFSLNRKPKQTIHRTVTLQRSPSPSPSEKRSSENTTKAVDRLRSATFRAPDDVAGCVEADQLHALFCRHHLAWRREALAELALLSSSDLAAMCNDLSTTQDDDLYLGLARRWGQRIQFVAPLRTETDVTMQEALKHVSLEPKSHDSGWLFHTHDELDRVLCCNAVPSSASGTHSAFHDPRRTLASAGPRKYWVFASDHSRDEPGGNSAHMLALYRVFSGLQEASFDAQSAIETHLPLDLFLQLGCMLAVVVQTEGTTVYVPSAAANESAHLVTTASDRAAISVAGNILNPRHIARLVHQHERDGPSEQARLEWARDFHKTQSEEADTESYDIDNNGLLLQVPTAGTISNMHTFLCDVAPTDARYRPEYHRQSWIPDLFSTSQAFRILSDALDKETLPSSIVVEQLMHTVRSDTADTVSVLAALAIKAATTATRKPSLRWHACHGRFGCPGHTQCAERSVQRLHSIKRPPILLTAATDTTIAQQALVELVNCGIADGIVQCNSFVPAKTGRTGHNQQQQRWGADRLYEYKEWSTTQASSDAKLTGKWVQDIRDKRGWVYLTDIVANVKRNKTRSASWQATAEKMVRELVGDHTASGFLLRYCSHRGSGVHTPNFFAHFPASQASVTSPHHNESHRVAAWHLLLRHPEPASAGVHGHLNSALSTPLLPALSSSSSSPPVLPVTHRATVAQISDIHRALVKMSGPYAGSDHLMDHVGSNGRSRRTSAAPLYGRGVSLAYGELTEHSCRTVMEALNMTSSSRLLDIGSAFGRFCVYAALSAPFGASVTGIEVCITRAKLATQFLDELAVKYNTILQPVLNNVRLTQGDILDHAVELFAHSHIFMFDARFVESTWHIISHLLSYMSGPTQPVVISCNALESCNTDLVCGGSMTLAMSGGQQFTARVFRVDPRMKRQHNVEVFPSPVHGLGVRTVWALRKGQKIMRAVGEIIHTSKFATYSAVEKRGIYPYLTRISSLDTPTGERAYMYALGVSRYVNSCKGTPYTANVILAVDGDELWVVALRDIGRAEELLADYHNWTSDGQLPWLRDTDVQSPGE